MILAKYKNISALEIANIKSEDPDITVKNRPDDISIRLPYLSESLPPIGEKINWVVPNAATKYPAAVPLH